MATRFLNRAQLWKRIPMLARKTPKAVVAVAFCGADSPKLLPLKRGSKLIVDASEATVKAGATCPAALIKHLRQGVEIYSVDYLHAKVFLFGRRVLIGSSNVSTNSARLLKEAALESDDAKVVRNAKEFIHDLDKTPLGPAELAKLSRIYQKPRFHFTGAKSLKREKLRTWLVPLVDEDWEQEDYRQADLGRPKARNRMTSRLQDFDLHEFQSESGHFLKKVKKGDRAIQVVKISKSRTEVYRDAPVLLVHKYVKTHKRNAVVFLEIKRHCKCKTLKQIQSKSPDFAKILAKVNSQNDPRSPRSLALRRAIRTIWPE
jgi:hypothetical protein